MEKPFFKVCGMTDGNNIREVESLGVSMVGFIFFPRSPRCARVLPDYLPARPLRVGVFVDETPEGILAKAEKFGLDAVQLHGHETPEFCASLRARNILSRNGKPLRIIKVFHIAREEDRQIVHEYEGLCNWFLFDTKSPSMGGTGVKFDWHIMDGYEEKTPFILSGGIGPDDARALKAFRHPLIAGYDLNSRFEVSPGIKDIARLRTFLDQMRDSGFPGQDA